MGCTSVNLCVEPQVLPVGLPENSQGENRPVIASLTQGDGCAQEYPEEAG